MKNSKKILALLLAAITVFAFAGCGGGQKSAKTPDPIKIGVPSDATNQARAISLLQTAGLIEVDPAAGFTPELRHITKYLYNIEIVPAAANTLVSTLDDYGAATINSTYATPAGLSPEKDGLATEVQDAGAGNPFINVIVAQTSRKDEPDFQTIVKAYQSQLVAEYTIEKSNHANVPVFDYDPNYTVPENFIEECQAYQTSSEGKRAIKVGTCGSGEVWKCVQKVLDDENSGIYIDLILFDAYNLPNEALNNGEIDLNSFQHIAYLNSEIASQKYDLTPIGNTTSAPLTLYSKKYKTIDELKEAAGKKE